MLTITQTYEYLQGCIGRASGVLFEVKSNVPLYQQQIVVDPAMWLDEQPQAAPTAPLTNVYKLTYPTAAGSYEMQYVGNRQQQNMQVNLEVIDGLTFKLQVRWVWRADAMGWDSSGALNSTGSFTQQAGIYTGVLKYFSVAVWAANEGAVFTTAAGAYYWCEGLGSAGITVQSSEEIGSYVAGEDLWIDVYIDAPIQTQINGNFQAGVFRTNGMQNAGLWSEDMDLNIASILGLGNVQHIDWIGGTADAIIDGVPLTVIDPGFWRGRFKVRGSYLQPNNRYTFYFVYKADGEYYSCTYTVGDAQQVTFGDVDCVSYVNGRKYTTCCLLNVPTFAEVTVCISMDAESYNTNLAINGHTGSYTENLQSISAYILDYVPQGAAISGGVPLQIDGDGCVTFTVPEGQEGEERFVVFVWRFTVDGETEVVYKYMRYTVSTDDFIYFDSFTDAEGNNLDYLCTDAGVVTACFIGPQVFYNFFATLLQAGNVVEGAILSVEPSLAGDGIGCVQIDTGQLTEGVQYCLGLQLIPTTVPSNPPTSCTCVGEDFTITQEVLSVQNGQVAIGWQIDLTGVALFYPSILLEVWHAGGTEQYNIQYDPAMGTVLTGTFTVPEGGLLYIDYRLTVTAITGCTYAVEWQAISSSLVGALYTVDVDVCDGAGGTPTEPPLQCQNFASITTECTEAGVVATYQTQGPGAILSAELRYNTNGSDVYDQLYSGPVNAPQVYFGLLVLYTDCESIFVTEAVDCFEDVAQCDNVPALAVTYDEATDKLTALNTGTYSSPIATLNLLYSLDDGVSFTQYGGPVDVSGLLAGDTVTFSFSPTYSDGCPQGPEVVEVWTKGSNVDNCDYTCWELSCEHNAVTDVFTANYELCVLPAVLGFDPTLVVDERLYSVDYGITWQTYTGGVQTTGDVVLFKWVLKYAGCEPEVLVAACSKPCDPCVVTWPESMDVNIVGPVQFEIINCVEVCDDTLCTTPPDAGLGGSSTVCIQI
jgi:hypothetical protein